MQNLYAAAIVAVAIVFLFLVARSSSLRSRGAAALRRQAKRSGGRPSARRPIRRQAARSGASGTTLASPMQGTIVKVAVVEGALVVEGDLVVVLEAMKMEQPLVAHRAGTVTGLVTTVGAGVSAGTAICEIVG